MSRAFFFFFYHRYLDKCLFRYLDTKLGQGSGSSRDVRNVSFLTSRKFFRLCPPCWSANMHQRNSASSPRYRRPIYSGNMSEIEYYDLIFEISRKISVNQLKRVIFMCTNKISKGSEGTIKSILELFKELEKQGHLGIDRLENLKLILIQLKKRSMLMKVEEFAIKRKGAKLMLVILIYFEIQRRKFEKREVPFCSRSSI